MSNKKRELIYSQQSSDFIAGRAYSNPRFFTTPRADVSKVLLVGDWPKIRAAYEALNVPVERLDPEAAVANPPATATAPAALAPGLGVVERAVVIIPDGWPDLPWSKPNADGLTLRGLATLVADGPVFNKAQATSAIEAELLRRASAGTLIGDGSGERLPPIDGDPDEESSNGLTRREMNADLEAVGVDPDPAMGIEELAELHAMVKTK